MNIMSDFEAYGLSVSIALFCLAYLFVHYKYIRHHQIHKRFLAALWKAMQNTIHGQHIRTLGYDHEKEQKKSD